MATERIEIVISERGSRTVRRNIENIGRSASTTQGAVALLNRALGAIASVAGLAALGRLADAYTNIQNRIRLVTRSSDELAAVQQELLRISQATRSDLQANTTLFFRLARASGNLNLSYKDLLGVTQATAQAIKVSGATSREAENAILQFSQGLASGALQGDELRSVVEQLPRLAEVIGKEFGVAGGQLRSFANANIGILKTERIIKALQAEIPGLADEFTKLTPTLADSFEIVNNALVQFVGGVNQSIGAGRLFNQVALTIVDNLDKIAVALLAIGGIAAFNFVAGTVANFGRILLGVLGFATGGLLTLGATIIRSVVFPFQLATTAVQLFASAALLVGGPLVRGFTAAGTAVVALANAMRIAGVATVAFIRQLSVLSLLFARGGAVYLGSLAFNALRIAVLGALNPIALLRGALVAVVGVFQLLKVAVLTNPLVLGGAVLIGGAVVAFVLLKDKIMEVIQSFGSLRNVANIVVGALIAAGKTIVDNWSKIPDALGDIVLQTVNSVVRGAETLINKSIGLINDFTGLVNRILPDELQIGQISTVKFDGVKNQFDGAASEIAESFNKILEEQLATDNIQNLQDKGQELLDFFKQFNTPALAGPELEALLGNLPDVPNAAATLGDTGGKRKVTFDSILKNLQDETEALKLNTREREIALKVIDTQDRLNRQLTASEEEQLRVVLELNHARMEENELLDEINGSVEQAGRKMDTLNRLFDDGRISVDQYNDKLRELRLEQLAAARDLESGIERGLLQIQEQFGDVASVAEDALVGAFRSAEDALVQFVTTGKADFKSLVDSIFQDLTRLAIRQAITAPLANALGVGGGGGFLGGLFGGLFGGGGGGLGGLFSGIGSLFGFENGGQFQVGGSGGPDSQLVAFRATPGENVTVRPKGMAAGSEKPVNINFNIQTPDAESFKRSQGQIMARASASINRANTRNN